MSAFTVMVVPYSLQINGDIGDSGSVMMYVVETKGCKRCGGDLFVECDSDGVYISCLQCGAVYNIRRDVEGRKDLKKVIAR